MVRSLLVHVMTLTSKILRKCKAAMLIVLGIAEKDSRSCSWPLITSAVSWNT